MYHVANLKPRRKLYTINLHHTQSAGMVNGSYLQEFIDKDLPEILALTDIHSSEAKMANDACRSALWSYRKLKGENSWQTEKVNQKDVPSQTGKTATPRNLRSRSLPPIGKPDTYGSEMIHLEQSSRDTSIEEDPDASQYPCSVCTENCKEKCIWCDLGLHWVHYECAALTPQKISRTPGT